MKSPTDITRACALLLCLCAAATAHSQKKKPAPAADKTKDTSSGVTALAEIPIQQASVLAGDYVPCKFTYHQLQSLEAPSQKLVLTPDDAERLVEKIYEELNRQVSAKTLTEAQRLAIASEIDKQAFVGLTASQATYQVIKDWDDGTKPDPKTAASIAEDLQTMSQLLGEHTIAVNKAAEDISQSKTSADNATKAAKTKATAPAKANAEQAATNSQSALTTLQSDSAKIDAAAAKVQQPAADAASKEAKTNVAAAAVIGSAQQAIDAFIRPDDVGCAMSILSWFETARAYGRIIANHYIAVQVVVRNLNRDQQFVLHDVELGVNVDPGGRLARFYSGRDRAIVRELSQKQQSFDIRNLTIGIAEGVGSVMSASSLVFGGALNDATSVFVSGFLPSLVKTWKDTSIDQLNLLSDTGFSSSSNAQMVVPKSGTVMFVTFIPSKQFEQGWWTQPCATRQFFAAVAPLQGRKLVALGMDTKVAGVDEISATGYDIDRALQSCVVDSSWSRSPDGSSAVTAVTKSQKLEDGSLFVNADPHPYKRWTGNQLAIFQDLSMAVVAGMHIVDDKTLQPALTALTCAAIDAKSGALKLPTDGSKTIACTIKGANLTGITTVRLRNARDAVDPNVIDGKPGGVIDDTAPVTFSVDDLGKAKGTDYSVRLLIKPNNVETAGGQTVHLDTSPVVLTVAPATLGALKAPDKIDVTGYHLGTVKTLTLTSPTSGAKPVTLQLNAAPPSDDTTLHFDTKAAAWTQLGKTNATLSLSMATADGTKIPVTQTMALTAAK